MDRWGQIMGFFSTNVPGFGPLVALSHLIEDAGGLHCGGYIVHP